MAKSLERILSVEDEEDIQAILKLALESVGGFTIEICGSGSEALERAPAFAADLILLDVMMPDMDGPTTLAALRKLDGTADIPVVFITAKVQASEIDRFKSLGAVGVIQKPFDPMDLSEQINDLWQNHVLALVGADDAGYTAVPQLARVRRERLRYASVLL